MPLAWIARYLINRAERRIGVSFDYVHKISQVDLKLLGRYNKIFGLIDPNTKVPAAAYHAVRLRGALAADCGSCASAEISLALKAGIDPVTVTKIMSSDYSELPKEIAAVSLLADAVTRRREDDPEARENVRRAFGDAGLIELAFAMNGAALLPGIKRAMGYAVACDVEILRKQARNAR